MAAEINRLEAKPLDFSAAGDHAAWAEALASAIFGALPDSFHGRPYVAAPAAAAGTTIAPAGTLLVKLWNRQTGYKHKIVVPLGADVDPLALAAAAEQATTRRHGQRWRQCRDTKWTEQRAA